jgi:hypothetical protein
MRHVFRRTVPWATLLAITAPVISSFGASGLEAQAPDSMMVVDVPREADTAFAMVLDAFAEAGIEVAIASTAQGLVLSETERMGRRAPYAYAQFRADLVSLGPLTRVSLRGIVSPTEDLDRPVTVTAGSFFQGALVWARLQWVGRELKKATTERASDPADP